MSMSDVVLVLLGVTELSVDSINSTLHRQVQREAALQGMVLLQNNGKLLPLKKGGKIAVVGPMGVTQLLTSDYAGG
jgi:beta-glucosidase-like glycosyl hydrolase